MQGRPGQNTGGGCPWPAPPGKPQGQHTQWTATDHIGAAPPCPCTADLPGRAEVGGQCSHPVLATDWPELIPHIDLPTATKAQLQEGVLSPHEGHALSTQVG